MKTPVAARISATLTIITVLYALLIIFFAFSFRPLWDELLREGHTAIAADAMALGVVSAIALSVFVIAHKRRRLFERWPYPEALGLFVGEGGVTFSELGVRTRADS